MRSTLPLVIALMVALAFQASPGSFMAGEAIVAPEGPGVSEAVDPGAAESDSRLIADPFFGASEFSTETATCSHCISLGCQNTGPCPGRDHPDPRKCKCRTCNGEFDCWLP